MFELMAAPFAACVVLVGIHAYLGMHVIERKIIFVDLALAQIAAFGATFGFLLGLGPHERGAYFFSLGFAIVGAAIFALTRMRHERIPQEAIIGIVYAVALASAILVADRAPEGAEHIKETLVGTLLWVRWSTVAKTAVIYALVGLLHFVLRKRFLQISFDPRSAYAEGRLVRVWDFVFYVTFALVITSSVAIAGVLVVFSFLVIPAVIASLFAHGTRARLAVGWSAGILASLIGMVASYRFDLPSGPAVVVSLGSALLLAGLVYTVVSAPSRSSALLKVLAGTAVVAGVLVGLGIFVTSGGIFVTSGTFMQIAHEHDWERDRLADEHGHGSDLHVEIWDACGDDLDCSRERLLAIDDWPAHAAARLRSGDEVERTWWVDLLGGLDDPRTRELLAGAVMEESDALLRLEIAGLLVDAGDPRGLAAAVSLLSGEAAPLVRDGAYELVVAEAGREFGYDPFGSEADNVDALERIVGWLAGRGAP